MRSVLKKTVQIGKVAALAVGLAVMLAVLLGVATTALAAAPGDPFRLGRLNVIDRISVLRGESNGPMLRVFNRGNSPALDLRTKAGKPPLTVNSAARVPRLNADKVDGKDASQLRGQQGPQGEQGEVGISEREVVTGSSRFDSDGVKATGAACPPGKTTLGGGGFISDDETNRSFAGELPVALTASFPQTFQTDEPDNPTYEVWRVFAEDDTGLSEQPWRVIAYAVCAELN